MNPQTKYKTIGILGGMGPEATAEFYLRIIKIFQKEYGARDDADFPKIFICNLPLPDVVGSVDTSDGVKVSLVNAAKELAVMGAEFIAVPCNTVSYFIDEVRAAVSVPVLSIPEEVALDVKRRGLNSVGILGTEMTIQKDLYGKALGNIQVLAPFANTLPRLTKVITNLLCGKKENADRLFLQEMINELRLRGAEEVILGCTELPLLIKEKKGVLDTIALLAEVTVQRAIGTKIKSESNRYIKQEKQPR